MKRKQRSWHFDPVNLLLLTWIEAAEAWRQLRSDPAEAKCRAARAAYYTAVWGIVPPIREERRETA